MGMTLCAQTLIYIHIFIFHWISFNFLLTEGKYCIYTEFFFFPLDPTYQYNEWDMLKLCIMNNISFLGSVVWIMLVHFDNQMIKYRKLWWKKRFFLLSVVLLEYYGCVVLWYFSILLRVVSWNCLLIFLQLLGEGDSRNSMVDCILLNGNLKWRFLGLIKARFYVLLYILSLNLTLVASRDLYTHAVFTY